MSKICTRNQRPASKSKLLHANRPLARVEQRPQRTQRATTGIESQLAVVVGRAMPRYQLGAGSRMPYVGRLMHREETESALVRDAVKPLKTVDFCSRHPRNLRFVGVQRSKPAGDMTAFRQPRELLDQARARR